MVRDDGSHAAGRGDPTLLANVYLHYVFDLWVEAWRRKVASGEMVVVRYADDLVVGFATGVTERTFTEHFLSTDEGQFAQNW